MSKCINPVFTFLPDPDFPSVRIKTDQPMPCTLYASTDGINFDTYDTIVVMTLDPAILTTITAYVVASGFENSDTIVDTFDLNGSTTGGGGGGETGGEILSSPVVNPSSVTHSSSFDVYFSSPDSNVGFKISIDGGPYLLHNFPYYTITYSITLGVLCTSNLPDAREDSIPVINTYTIGPSEPIQLGIPTASPLSGFSSAVPFEVAFFASDPDVNLEISVDGGGYVTLDELAPVYFVTQSVNLSVRAVSQNLFDGRLPSSPLVCSYVISSGGGGETGGYGGGAGSGQVDIRDLGYAVFNGSDGKSILNTANQVQLGLDADNMTLPALRDRVTAIADFLDGIYGNGSAGRDIAKVTVSKVNFPAFLGLAPATEFKTDVKKVSVLVEIKQLKQNDPGERTMQPLKIQVVFNGVPADLTRADLKPKFEALFTESFGFCNDGITRRFNRVLYISSKGITKQ